MLCPPVSICPELVPAVPWVGLTLPKAREESSDVFALVPVSK